MSDESLQLIRDVEEALTAHVSRASKLLYALIGAVIGGTVWFTTMQIGMQQLRHTTDTHTTELKSVSDWRITTDATMYTRNEHYAFEQRQVEHDEKANTLLSERNLLQEKRLQRLEDNQTRLIEITEKLSQKL